jgi:hypothetical protein
VHRTFLRGYGCVYPYPLFISIFATVQKHKIEPPRRQVRQDFKVFLAVKNPKCTVENFHLSFGVQYPKQTSEFCKIGGLPHRRNPCPSPSTDHPSWHRLPKSARLRKSREARPCRVEQPRLSLIFIIIFTIVVIIARRFSFSLKIIFTFWVG